MAKTKEEMKALYLKLGLDISLFGIASECPYDGKKSCPVKKVKELHGLTLEERYDTIRNMTQEEKLDLLDQTLDCAVKCQYQNV